MAHRERRWTVFRIVLTASMGLGTAVLWGLPDHYGVTTLRPSEVEAVPGRAGMYRFAIAEEMGTLLRWNLPPLNMSFLFEDDVLLWLRTDPPEFVLRPPTAPASALPAGKRLEARSFEPGWHALWGGHVVFAPREGDDPRRSGKVYRWEVHGPLQGWRLAGWCMATLSLLALGLVPGERTAAWLSWITRGWLSGLAAMVVVALLAGRQVPDRIVEANSASWLVTRVVVHAEDHGPGWGIVLAAAGALHTVVAAWRGFPVGRAELRLRAWLIRWGGAVMIPLCVLSWWKLSEYGAGHRSFSDSAPYSSPIGSAIAWSDAAAYVQGVWVLLDAGELDEYSQRRSINACLGAARLAATGFSPTGASLLQVVLLGGGLAFAVTALARRFGSWTAVAAWSFCWGYARFFLDTALSEPLGLALGAYGLGLLLRSADQRSAPLALAGLFALSLAQAARPGALFVLPALGCWFAWCAGDGVWRKCAWLLAAATVVVGGVSVLSGLNRLYGTQENVSGSNFSYTLAGLAMGKNWKEVRTHYQSELDRLPTEGEKARFLYAEAGKKFRENPRVMVSEFARGTKMFAVELLPSIVMFSEHATTRSFRHERRIVLGIFLCLALAGCVRTLLGGNGLPGLWFWGAIGVLASIPFVFLDGGWRIVAPVWPAMAGWFATAFAVRHRMIALSTLPDPQAGRDRTNGRMLRGTAVGPAWPHIVILATVVLAAAAGPAAGHRLAPRVQPRLAPQVSGESRVVQLIPGWSAPPIQIVASDVVDPPVGGVAQRPVGRRSYAPQVGYTLTWREFQRRLQHGKIEARDYLRAAAGEPPSTLQQAYDAATRQLVWVGWTHRVAAGPSIETGRPPQRSVLPGQQADEAAQLAALDDLRLLPPPHCVRMQTILSHRFIGTGLAMPRSIPEEAEHAGSPTSVPQ